MTTIAADAIAGVMCSDSHWIMADESGSLRKVWRIRGALYGLAGDLSAIVPWIEWERGKGEQPTLDLSTITVLRLDESGLSTWTEADGWLPVGHPKHAIGSGGKAARAAMYVGASCQQAVRAAIEVDAGSGGAVRTYKLRPSRG